MSRRGWAIGDSVRRWVPSPSPLTGFLKKPSHSPVCQVLFLQELVLHLPGMNIWDRVNGRQTRNTRNHDSQADEICCYNENGLELRMAFSNSIKGQCYLYRALLPFPLRASKALIWAMKNCVWALLSPWGAVGHVSGTRAEKVI